MLSFQAFIVVALALIPTVRCYWLNDSTNVPEYEISALWDIYEHTGGQYWTLYGDGNKWNFSAPNPCADAWIGVTCSNISYSGFLHVLVLQLSNFSMFGPIPATIGNLTQLQILNCSKNFLLGDIPETMFQNSQLAVLDLSYNALSGWIPQSIGACYQLTSFFVDFNRLSGNIFDVFGGCGMLNELHLSNNRLTGPIPDDLSLCKNLSVLALNNNYFIGDLLVNLFGATNLTVLDLGSNFLTGTIAESIDLFAKIRKLDFHFNQLTNDIPSSIGNCTELLKLDVSHNILEGTIPHSLYAIAGLEQLVFSYNQFSGTISPALGVCSALIAVDFSYNQLGGTIPAELSWCTKLTDLDFSGNNLVGTLPNILPLQLIQFSASDNHLNGSLPAVLFTLYNIQLINLVSNRLTGTVPALVFTGSNNTLTTVNLGDNRFTGTISGGDIGGLLSLVELDLSNNSFHGTIPHVLIESLPRISTLRLNDNEFTGTIPQNWATTSNTLEFLYLQGNSLVGPMPATMGNLLQLQTLNLSFNHLTGNIPANFQQLRFLRVLMLHNNNLRGAINGLFDNLQLGFFLVNAQFSSNQFTGTLPEKLFLSPSLSSFAAVDNCFDGPLPVEAICSSALTVLVLDGLHAASSCSRKLAVSPNSGMFGTFPSCLLSMANLTTLHMSGMALEGSISTNIPVNPLLADLSLSNNLITGIIPKSILGRNWTKLDLSYNRLTGTLHSAASTLYGNTSQMLLQQNRLSGVIPSSFQRVGSLSLLTSNLFSCSADGGDLPQQDSASSKYSCGSDSVNNLFYAWLVFAAMAVTLCCCLTVHYRVSLPEFFSKLSSDLLKLPALSRVMYASQLLLLLGTISAVYCAAVLLPIHFGATALSATYTYQYAWTVSGAFLSGRVAFAMETITLVVLLLVAYCFIKRFWTPAAIEADSAADVGNALYAALTGKQSLLYALYLLFNVTIVAGVNVAFVLSTLSINGWRLLAIQILLAGFKLGFNNVITPAVHLKINHLLAKDGQELPQEFATVQLFASLVNNILIPCLVVLSESPSCFYDLLFAITDPSTSSYTYGDHCLSYEQSYDATTGVTSTICTEVEILGDQTSYTPPFKYSYQCSSTFITSYAPTFVTMCIISGFLIPAHRQLMAWLQRNYAPKSPAFWIVTAITPRLLKGLQSPEDLAMIRNNPMKPPLFEAPKLVMTLMTYLTLLLTFGALFPPLAACCAVAMGSVLLFAQIDVRRYVATATVAGRKDCLDEIERSCADVAAPRQLHAALEMVLTVSCWFYTLFLFDTLGNEVGFAGAYWVLIVMPLLPVLALASIAVVKRGRTAKNEITEVEVNSSTGDVEMGVQLVELPRGAAVAVTVEHEEDKQVGSEKASNPIHSSYE